MTRYIVRKSDDGFESCLANTDTRAEARKIRDEYKGSDK